MKVYILTDMEGITGIVHPDQLSIEQKEYARARKFFTNDVNGAIEGALEAGASDVVVCDGHGTMRNILIEDINEKARLITGPAEFKDFCQIIGLDNTYDAAVFIGFHAKACTPKAILSHTWVGGAVHHFKINGKVLGETGIDAAICGEYGVPVVAVSGDDILAQEVTDTLGSEVKNIIVKKALARTIAECYPPKYTKDLIKNSVKEALANRKNCKPFKVKTPCEIEVGFYVNQMADKASTTEGVEKIGDREILIKDNDFLKAIATTWKAIVAGITPSPDWLK